MLLPNHLATMRLGIHPGWVPPAAPERLSLTKPPPAYSRIVSTPRVAGQNDRIGDCFPTACLNGVETTICARLGESAQIMALPDELAVVAYEGMTGYVPGQPATDQGTDPEAGFAWWQKNAIAGYRLVKAAPIDPKAQADIRHIIATSLGVLLCISLSTDNQNQRVLTPVGEEGSWGGHAVWMDGYDGALTSGTSWGEPFYLDQSFFDAGWVMAAYALTLAPT